MKKFYNPMKSLMALFAIAATMSLLSCKDDNTSKENGGDDPAKDYTTVEVTGLTQGEMAFYGGYYSGDSHNWVVSLATDAMDLATYEGSGKFLMLELNAPLDSTTEIAAGTYEMIDIDLYDIVYAPFTVMYAYSDGDGYPFGTWYFEDYTDDEKPYYGATRGTVEVEKQGSTYTVSFDLYDDDSEVHLTGSYTGALSYFDGTQEDSGNTGGDGDTGGDVNRDEYDRLNITNLTQGEAIYYGEYYADNVDNWIINLAGSGFNFTEYTGNAPFVMLELNTTAGMSNSIPEGTYTVMDPNAEEDIVTPFTAVYGYTDDEGYLYGTWLFEDYDSETAPYYGATAGTVTVSKNGENYTITFDIYDDEYYGHATGSYTGSLTVYNESQPEISAQSVDTVSKRHGRVHKMNAVRKAVRR